MRREIVDARRIAVARALFAVCLLTAATAVALRAGAQDLRVHGPILQWQEDPSTTMTVTWIDREIPAPPPRGEWLTAQGGFGYNSGDATATHLTDMRGGYRRIALRRAVTFDDVPDNATLILNALYDDAMIVRLNGHEIVRAGVQGSGTSAHDVQLHEAYSVESFTIDGWRTFLRDSGEDILSIEGHNASLDSSDFSIITQLLWRAGDAQQIIIPHDAEWEFFAGDPEESDWYARLNGAPAFTPERGSGIAAQSASGKYRTAGAEHWVAHAVESTPFADTGNMIRRMRMAGLLPDTEYEFRLPVSLGAIDDRLAGTAFRFRTAPGVHDRPVSFVTGGDMFHRRDWLDAMNRRAGLEDPLFALLGGDLAYANGRDANRWYEWIDSWSENAIAPDGRLVPMILAIGNHETGSGLSPEEAAARNVHPHAKFFYSLFLLPDGKTNYAVDFGDWMSVICLDSNETQPISAQADWLAEALEARQDRMYRFVCYHKPTYGTGVKDDIAGMREHWVPLFEKFGVTAVFENDHHMYKRTHPIRDGRVNELSGVPYLGDGAWGVEVRPIPDQSDRPHIAHAESVRHLIRVDLSEGMQSYTAMDADGKTIDAWVRQRRASGGK